MKILLIILLWFVGATSNKKVYTIVSEGITNIQSTNTNELTLAQVQQLSNQNDNFKTGTQKEIEDFNKSANWSIRNSGFQPRPFSNRTNSYWIFPNFQFGPGSVNDFGNNPNAQQMLGPYIF